jgi:hypothetical protein
MILYESAGMELGSLEVDGLMDQLMLHSVLYKMARHTHTTSPSLVKEELSYIMLTSHG